tara:strand:- start:195 stop:374 length:180 start_codon:yes stop_codon:yes gene_type:complete
MRLAERFTKETNATAKPRRENPIAHHRFTDEACVPPHPQIIPPKNATIMAPYIARTWIE